MTVDAADGGTARFDVEGETRVGDQGPGALQITNGGQFVQTGNFFLISPESTGQGEVAVSGLDSRLESFAMHVGRGGPGRLMVTGGASFLARSSLLLGDGSDDQRDASQTLVRITGANSRAIASREVFVERATLHVTNGGFFQAGQRLHLGSPGVVDVLGGSAEVGNAGGAPPGVLRVDQGLLDGSGSIRANSVEVINQGVCRPGEFTYSNELRINGGQYVQGAAGTLDIDIRSKMRFGTLVVDGNVSLSGKLTVSFVRDFAPLAGDEFGFIRFGGGLSGSFSEVTVHGLASGVTYEVRLLAPGVYGLAFLSDATTAACTASAPYVEEVDMSTPGEVGLTIVAGPCGLYELEFSYDMVIWRSLQRFPADLSGRVRLVDRRGTLFPSMFYRVVRL